MTRPFVFEKPLGMRDTLPLLYETKKKIRRKMEAVVQSWGYQFIATPTLEYYDTVGSASATLDQQLFKLMDQQGKTLVLRPDMTSPIARVAGSSLKQEPYPLRLAYDANVFRAQQHEGGRPAEFEQVGIELIGDGTTSADGEVIALMIEMLKKAGVGQFQVAIGHIGFIHSVFVSILGNEERANKLRRFLYEKNYVGYRQHVKELSLSSIDKHRLLELLKLRGGKESIERAYELLPGTEGERFINELSNLYAILESYGAADTLKIDLTLVSHMNYYTGIVFESYAENLGVPISNGGRYDELLAKFDRPAQATGFGIRLDRLVEAIDQREEPSAAITGIIFSPERRQEAIELAREKREEGKMVVLQDLNGVQDVDAMSEQFADVIYCIGKNGRGGKS
ncbi:ATP phosphoribosyltransferase regulatory subunit [Pseudalkalibacillus caeni]|uniref:ATP phosphoribosyltransferase regulatory subunit n=1 Tax=Exobacillus caeni TaxID=2574798 RepID=A0A5R9FA72_9BACL|nr:ATP phosphoribosyltransferase regulatory subunit [Pseudalkalibacillus caeni]TLS38548.1 ATP phosphoribosyltransferase regulatory subunit [Pseudalkalibacillus caeni]